MFTIMNNINVGIQSWCFRGLKGNDAIVEALGYCNTGVIELCGIHIDVSNSQEVHEVINLYNRNGISFSSYGIDFYPNDEMVLRNKFEFAKKANINVLGADPDPDAFDLIDRLCSEYNIRIAIHNHGRDHRYGHVRQLEEVYRNVSENIGLCLDTGWALDAGEDPVNMINKFPGRLYGVHFKDFTFDEKSNPIEAILGTGELDLKKIFSALSDINFQGYATLEYEGDVDDPVPSLKESLKALEGVS